MFFPFSRIAKLDLQILFHSSIIASQTLQNFNLILIIFCATGSDLLIGWSGFLRGLCPRFLFCDSQNCQGRKDCHRNIFSVYCAVKVSSRYLANSNNKAFALPASLSGISFVGKPVLTLLFRPAQYLGHHLNGTANSSLTRNLVLAVSLTVNRNKKMKIYF